MKIAVLSRNPRLYSTRRLVNALLDSQLAANPARTAASDQSPLANLAGAQ
ncbi:MAG: hypothetical protein Q8R10_18985 [Pseudomonas sp.]|nr:hypothetical protein [Pseudomonas sp.]MDP3848508.1 hypothetical protein [Pseudomonas sp.]